jgi:dolichol-phosphate mannosyltransferase
MRPLQTALHGAQAAAAALALARLARGRTLRPPLRAARPDAAGPTVSMVIPARDEEERIGPCLDGALADPDVLEVVVVVDDGTADATAAIAERAGARVLHAPPLPEGWVGKPWVLQHGLERARGEIVLTLDADTRPRPGLARALAAVLGEADYVTAAGRFECESVGERLLHPSLLASLIYRFGPLGSQGEHPPPSRVLANGQCVAVRREQLLGAGGFAIAREHMNDDIALVRALAAAGWRIRAEDGTELLSVRMHTSASEVWREWGRSIAMQDTTPPAWLAADLAVVWLVMALPVLRLLTGRPTPLDLALALVRFALLGALRGGYEPRGVPYALSPLADPAAALCITLAVARPRRTWRGRSYRPPGERIPRAGSALR